MHWLKKLLVLMGILWLSTCLVWAQSDQETTLAIGAVAPDFKLQGIDGKNYRLKNFNSADVLVIIFTANHCPTAQAYEDRIIQLVNDYQSKNVAIVAISSNHPKALRLDEMGYTDLGDAFEDMKIRAKDKGYNFIYLYDGDQQKAAIEYGAQATPHVFIFDKKRQLRYTGRFDDSENPTQITSHDTRNAIDAILTEKKIEVEKTKTFGCSIKWANKIAATKKAVEQWNLEPVQVALADLDMVKTILANDSENLRLLNIWATWCGPCVAEFPELIEINRMYRNREFELVTISLDNPDKNARVLKFLQKHFASNQNYHYILNDKYKFIETIGNEWQGAIPFTLLIKPGGEVIFKKMGMIDPLALKKEIVTYLGRYYHRQ